MKKKILIVSDIVGFKKTTWISHYLDCLSEIFEITILDINNLTDTYFEDIDKRYKKFIEVGIDEVVKYLSKSNSEYDVLIGFSMGGTILWKYKKNINSSSDLICISSTRLRFENSTPRGRNLLLFGDLDMKLPSPDWLKTHKKDIKILSGKDHDFFKEVRNIETICQRIIDFCG